MPAARTILQPRPATQPEVKLDAVLAWLLEQAGISPDSYRTLPLQRRLPALLRLLHVDSPEAAQVQLEAKPELLPAALNSLLIGVSSFFRDTAVFESLGNVVLPALLQTRQGLNVFSAGVSDGYELYSVAILLAEAGALKNSALLGVDCRPDALARARLGYFSDAEVAAVNDTWRGRYFRAEGTAWRAEAMLSRAIQWRCADLVTFTPPPSSDLILFRNVAIYLREQCMASVWAKLCSSLAPGGYLITGSAEKPPADLALQCVSKSIYQKKDAAP